MAHHSVIAEHLHVGRAVEGPADLALIITALGGDEYRVALTKDQAERLAILIGAHVRHDDA
jgi:hypothetical protein